MKNQKPKDPQRTKRGGLDPGTFFKIVVTVMMLAAFAIASFVDALPNSPTLGTMAVTACDLAASAYFAIAFLILLVVLAARMDSDIANRIYLTDDARSFASRPYEFYNLVEVIIQIVVTAALWVNGHTNMAGFFFLATLAPWGCAWLIAHEVRRHNREFPSAADAL